MDDADWERLISQLRRGDCTPLLGAGACVGTLPSGSTLSRKYAHLYSYPFTDTHNLARVMQYAQAVVRDPVDLKQDVCDHLQSQGTLSSGTPDEPHAVLAQFPIKAFLTTNYDDFLRVALLRAGKAPTVAVSEWWDTSGAETPLPEPTVDQPLVYHLHGSWSDPSSLVLTEADYLTYLVNMVDSRTFEGRPPLPEVVLNAMSTRPLLFIGYSLQDWTFRVLFHGLARDIPRNNRRRHVSVQLMPEVNSSAVDAEKRAEQYLQHYLNDWNISIYLGTAAQFCEELRRRTGGSP